MISEIKKYIDEHPFVSLAALSQHFQVESSAMEKMMEVLLEKAYAQKLDGSGRSCAGCLSPCAKPEEIIYYEKI
ncbi:MAG TPA: FeoC-like transcriptional regulator [Candidatus Omnitrophota bacterium]|nr:FeoC-like transcriptional regulator [Candidatus Omnitrophota bacterium]HPN88497.1 FeoC-like transcriptional regulator [Candidatus Omnitrophota bacterium]